MKRLICKLILFLLPLALLVLFMENGLAGIPNSYSVKKKNLERELSNVQIILVGSSHAYFDIDPDLFSCKAYNMANVSQSLYYDTEIIRKYLPGMKNLRMVVFSITYFSFGFKLADSQEDWRGFYYERYYDIPREARRHGDFLELRDYSLMALYGGKDSFKYMRKGFRVNLAEHVQPNGWYASTVPLGLINDETGKLRVQNFHSNMHADYVGANYDRVDKLFALLRQKGIEPVIITPPLYKTCYDYLDPAGVRKMEELINSLCARYKVLYFNYLKDKRFVLDDFSDNDHLNPQGAGKFTRILSADILGNHAPGIGQTNR